MSILKVENLVVEFPTYNSDRSLKRVVLRASTGGRIARDTRSHVFVRALDNVSFELKTGDRLGLIGHNGSGKTTLLRVLAGAYEPVAGRVEMVGRVASLLDINMGIESEATGYENIILRGLMMGLQPGEIRSRAQEIAEFTELGDYLRMPVRTYSSGMQVRLAFAVSTAISADILLMDEWLSVGDSGFQERASNRLETMIEQSSVFVIASHSPELLARVCNRVIRLEHGRIVEVIEDPKTLLHQDGSGRARH